MHSQKRVKKAQALAERVLDLTLEDGLLTADELARRLEISRATFFRMFGSKEQAIVLAISGPAEQAAEAIRAAPPLAPDAPIWPLLRRGFEPMLLRIEADPERFLKRIAMLRMMPEVRMGAGNARLPRILALMAALEERGLEGSVARVFAAAASAAFDNVLSVWAQEGGAVSPRSALDEAFARLEAGR